MEQQVRHDLWDGEDGEEGQESVRLRMCFGQRFDVRNTLRRKS